MTEIPANCVLSKGITGCGATTLGIEQKGHTLIAKCPNCGYDTVKIATTFDSLRKVADSLARYGFDAYKDAHLLVDE